MTPSRDEPGKSPSLAEKELFDARRDPRLEHGREGMVADWWAAMHAAERAHKLGVWGLHELTLSLEREEARLGFRNGAPGTPPGVAAELQAAWERSEIAKAEQENETVELNAMTLVAMVSALDAMVEYLVPDAQEMLVRQLVEQTADLVARQAPQTSSRAPAEQQAVVKEAIVKTLREDLRKIDRLYDAGVIRWERLLKHAGLQAPANRPVPADLDEALSEIVTLRHVLVHRAGRVDPKALKAAPSWRLAAEAFEQTCAAPLGPSDLQLEQRPRIDESRCHPKPTIQPHVLPPRRWRRSWTR
jgi:hypothetical protein